MFPEKHHTETEASYFAWQQDSHKIYKIMNFLSFELRVCIYTKVCNKKLQANKVTTRKHPLWVFIMSPFLMQFYLYLNMNYKNNLLQYF